MRTLMYSKTEVCPTKFIKYIWTILNKIRMSLEEVQLK